MRPKVVIAVDQIASAGAEYPDQRIAIQQRRLIAYASGAPGLIKGEIPLYALRGLFAADQLVRER